MKNADLREKTKLFALATARFYVDLPQTTEAQILMTVVNKVKQRSPEPSR
jgi:hypothetical protein